MSTNIEVEPGASSESVLVATESFDNFEQMSSSLDEIKSTNVISQSEESNENDNSQNEQVDENTSSLSKDEDEDQVINKEWTDRKKHIFVLSLAGKPIYSR